MKNRTNILVNAFGVIVSILLFAGIFYLVPVKDVWAAITEINVLYLLALAFATILNLILKAKRWSLLCPVETGTIKSSAPINISLAINNVLPGKLGEIIRVALTAKLFNIKYSTSAATVLGDRLLDTVALLMIAGFSFLLIPDVGNQVGSSSMFSDIVTTEALVNVLYSFGILSILLVLFIIALLFDSTRSLLLKVLNKTPLVGNKIKSKIESIILGLTEGLDAFRSSTTIIKTMLYSIILWLFLALGTWALSFGINGLEITILEAIVISTISVLAASLPSSPGAWGIFEAGTILSIQLLGIECSDSSAVAFAFALHFGQYITVIIAGVVSMFMSGLKTSDISIIKNQRQVNE